MILHESDSRAQCDFAPEIAAHSGDESVVYKRVGQEPLYLSLYFPPHGGQDGMRPILLLVHGGGWRGKKVFPEQPHWVFWLGITPSRAIFAPASITGCWASLGRSGKTN